MPHHPFRLLLEKGASAEEFAALLAPDVILHSPLVINPVRDKMVTSYIIATTVSHLGIPHIILELTENQRTVLLYEAQIKGYDIQISTVITDNADGLIQELRIFLRPYSVATLFWEAMLGLGWELAYANLPKDFWERVAAGRKAQQE